MRLRHLVATILLGSAALAFGCADSGDAPLTPHRLDSVRAVPPVRALTTVSVVQRLEPLAEDLVVTRRVGRSGGQIRIEEAGLWVRIPPNALPLERAEDHLDITVTALKGGEVAYTFAPHGVRFRRPLEVRQDARVTTVPRAGFESVRGAYFADRSLVRPGTALVSEFRPTEFDQRGRHLVWSVDHFSGYLLAFD